VLETFVGLFGGVLVIHFLKLVSRSNGYRGIRNVYPCWLCL